MITTVSRSLPPRMIAWFAAAWICGAVAADSGAPVPSDGQSRRGWLEQQQQKFHGYAHLDHALRLTAAKRWEEARQELQHVLDLEPDNQEARRALMVASYELRNYDEVVRQANLLLAQHGSSASAQLYRALARQAMGSNQAALADFQKVCVDPKAEEHDRRFALSMVAELSKATGDWPVAQEALERLVATSDSFALRCELGVVLDAQEQLTQASETFWRAYALTRNRDEQVRALMSVAEVNAKLAHWEIVQAAVLAALALNQEIPLAPKLMARASYGLGDVVAAADWAARSLELNPQDPALRELRAHALVTAGNTTAALHEFATLITAVPSDDERHRISREAAFAAYADNKVSQAAQWMKAAVALQPSDEDQEFLANLLYEQHDYDEAASTYRSLLRKKRDAGDRYRLAMALGYALMQTGEVDQAATAFAEAAAADATFVAQRARVEALIQAGRLADAVEINSSLLKTQGLPSETRVALWQQQGHLLLELGRFEAAAKALEQGVADSSAIAETRATLGLSLFAAGHVAPALEQFRASYAAGGKPQILLYTAQCYEKLQKPGLAVHALRGALVESKQLSASEIKTAYDQLGYLYAEMEQYDHAAQAWAASLRLAKDDVIALKHARMLRLSDDLEQAHSALYEIDPLALPVAIQAEWYDEAAQIAAATSDTANAIANMLLAHTLAPSPAREFQLGNLYAAAGRPAQALAHLQTAVQQAPQVDEYAVALGYAYDQQGHSEQALPLLESVLARDADHIELLPDLGFLSLKMHRPNQAQRYFQLALDNEPYFPVLSYYAPDHNEQRLQAVRQAIPATPQRLQFSVYQMLTAKSYGRGDSAKLGIGFRPAQGGVEAALRLPANMLGDDDRWQGFARALWSGKPEEYGVDRDSLQGGLGLRFQPWSNQTLFVDLERQFRIGDAAGEDWLARVRYGWSEGDNLPRGEDWTTYSLVYVDAGYFFPDTADWAAYGELRYGMARVTNSKWWIAPHLVLDGGRDAGSQSNARYAEGGVGLTLRYLFATSPLGPTPASAELSFYYKAEIVNVDPGWVALAALRF
jgi:tetratricopeptide (TPR) repeat protein